ncbi:MAG TPA: YraN family protein [Candidatus Limnocylindria bacterium]|nr:YraN family protein [Candidatus Limnocylindria bacterium]
MSNYAVGHDAEKRAAKHLESLGLKIRELNWKTRYCEIDIVAQKDKAVYFVEVKYRRNTKQGSGTDYITPRKLRQMRFAAEMWVQNHQWLDDCRLAVVSIDADQISFIDDILL